MPQSKREDIQFLRHTDLKVDGGFVYLGTIQVPKFHVSHTNITRVFSPTFLTCVGLVCLFPLFLLTANIGLIAIGVLAAGAGGYFLWTDYQRCYRLSFTIFDDKRYEINALERDQATKIQTAIRTSSSYP